MQQSSNTKIIIISVIIAAISLTYGILNFHKAFPEIALNMQVSRDKAVELSQDYLESRNFDFEGFKESIIFTRDYDGELFLQKELGVDKTVELAKDTVDVWFWRVRFYEPLRKLSYWVKVNPEGEIIGFGRLLPEDQEGPKLSSETALILAEAFLTGSMNVELDKWEYIEGSSEDLPNRRDHTLTWELRGFEKQGAKYRMKVEVQGAEVGSFSRSLKVPEQWKREYRHQRSQNKLFQSIADFVSFILIAIAFVYFIMHIRGGQIPWRTAIILSVSLFAVNFIMGVNSLPLEVAYYNTTSSYSSFLSEVFIRSLLAGIFEALLLVLLIGAGEKLYRRQFPDKLALQNIFRWKGMKSREVVQGTIMGYVLVAFDLGFVVFYYIAGGKIGFWSPADVKYDNAVSTMLPWIYPLAISMGASLLEEFWFRFFGISFFKKITKSTLIAIVVPAFIWGFLHSNYPQQPGFARGIEVGIMGILAGLVMLRFGIWATLVWHFVLDAIWIGLFLFQSDNAYFWISGLIVCGALLIPAIVAGLTHLKGKRAEAADKLLNREVDIPEGIVRKSKTALSIEESPQNAKSIVRFSRTVPRKVVYYALIAAVCGLAALIIPGRETLTDSYQPKIDRKEAEKRADEAISERYGIDTENYIKSIIDVNSLYQDEYYKQLFNADFSYVRKHGSLEDAKEIFFSRNGATPFLWYITYMREKDAEEYIYKIDPLFGRYAIYHKLPDTTSGAKLERDSALVIAEQTFKRMQPDHEKYKLDSVQPREKENRRDYYFTWETIDPVIGEAHFIKGVNIVGDEALPSETLGLNIPEQWERHEKEKNIRWAIIQALGFITIIGFGVWGLVVFGKRLVKREIKWKYGLTAGVVIFIASVLDVFNRSLTFWWEYNTSEPIKSFVTSQIMQHDMSVLAVSLFSVLLVSMTEAVVRSAYGVGNRYHGEDGAEYSWKKQAGLFAGAASILLGVFTFITKADFWFSLPQHNFNLKFPETLAVYFPWLLETTEASISGVVFGSMVMFFYIVIEAGLGKSLFKWALLLIFAIVITGFKELSTANPSNLVFAINTVKIFLIIIAVYLTVKYLLPGSLMGLILLFYSLRLIQSLDMYYSFKDAAYFANIWALLAALLAPIGIYFYYLYRRSANLRLKT